MKTLKLYGENLKKHLNDLLSSVKNIGLSNRFPDPKKLNNTLNLLLLEAPDRAGIDFDSVSKMPAEAEITRLSNTKKTIEEQFFNHTVPVKWNNDGFITTIRAASIISRFEIKTRILKKEKKTWTTGITLDRWAINRNVYSRYSVILDIPENTYYFEDPENGCFPSENLINLISTACRFDSETAFLALSGNSELKIHFVSRGEIGPFITESNLFKERETSFLLFPLDICSPEINGRLGRDFLQKHFISSASPDMEKIFEDERKTRNYGTFCETRISFPKHLDKSMESGFQKNYPGVIIVRRI